MIREIQLKAATMRYQNSMVAVNFLTFTHRKNYHYNGKPD